MYKTLIIIITIFFSLQSYVLGQESSDLGVFGDWHATYWSTDGGVCTMMSVPVKEEGKYSKRGQVYSQIIKNNGSKDTGVIYFAAGYSFKESSEVNVKIDNKHSFTLFTNGASAWAQDSTDDKLLIKYMKLGNTMIVKGISSRGTNTKDTYSLKGFIAAYKAIDKKCK
jgi:hypothetical protein